jgi:hypothetical protein
MTLSIFLKALCLLYYVIMLFNVIVLYLRELLEIKVKLEHLV